MQIPLQTKFELKLLNIRVRCITFGVVIGKSKNPVSKSFETGTYPLLLSLNLLK